MDSYRIKSKIGVNEFDADGPAEMVREDYDRWLAKITNAPITTERTTEVASTGAVVNQTPAPSVLIVPPKPEADVDAAITRIMRVDKRTVSLTATPSSVEEAVLLLLYGQRVLRNNESPTGSEIVAGVEETGGLDIGRSDRMFEKIARNGDVIMIGERRGKRYRLTNAGISKARQIAASMLALIA